jgi:hypothetical protein
MGHASHPKAEAPAEDKPAVKNRDGVATPARR